MAKYKRRSVTIDAFQWRGYDNEDLPKWFTTAEQKPKDEVGACLVCNNAIVRILTIDGILTAYKNDFIIRTDRGEIYPCPAPVFHLLHDKTED